MSFSLRTLFWIFPVTLLAYGLSYFEASLQFMDTVFRASSALRMAKANADAFAEYQQQSGIQFDIVALNQWLHRSLASTHPQESIFAAIQKTHYLHFNSLEVVALDAAGNPAPDQTMSERVGFYERRPDRTPLAGTDPVKVLNRCTFNSWNTTHDEVLQYDRQIVQHQVQARAIENWPWALALLVLTLIVTYPVHRWFWSKVAKFSDRPEPSLPSGDKVWPLP